MRTNLELQTADILIIAVLVLMIIIAVRIVIGFFGGKKK